MTPILPLQTGMTAVMRKPHPCGGNRFRILRTGADVRVECTACGREMTMPRVKFEKAVSVLEDAATE